MSHYLPESISAVDTMLTFRRADDAPVGAKVVGFLSVVHWLKGRAESPTPLCVKSTFVSREDGLRWSNYVGVYPDGTEGTIRVSGRRAIYVVADQQL